MAPVLVPPFAWRPRSNRAIGNSLFLSSRAVERHVQAIFKKLGLSDTDADNRRVLAVLALLGH